MAGIAADDVEAIAFERARDRQTWARWLARGLDGVFLLPFAFLVLAAASFGVQVGRIPAGMFAWAYDPVWSVVGEIVLTFLLFCLWEPLFLANTGTTPGKWMMGISVRDTGGGRLGVFKALGRYAWIFVLGMGVGIPVLAVVAMLYARAKLMGDGVTPWDAALKCEVRHKKRSPPIWALSFIIVIGVNAGIQILNRLG